MNILQLLKADHDKVKGIIANICNTSDRSVKTRIKLLSTLKDELVLHEEIEETIFYPPLKQYEATKDLILEAYEEHHIVDVILEELEGVEPQEENWLPKLNVLKENLEHHIHEEEEELFPKVRKVLTTDELQKMGEKMQQMKAGSGKNG